MKGNKMSNICPQGSTFHWKNGWMFARGEANYVHVWRGDIELNIPPNEWDSIVKAMQLHSASTKAALERAEGYVRAAAFSEGSEPPHKHGQALKDLALVHDALSRL
jgi:hypothetical protein